MELRDYFAALVAERRESPQSDLTSALAAAHDAEGTISEEELLASLALVIAAGFITTMNLLGNGLAILLDHPDLTRRLRLDPSLAPAYIEEMLRYDCPVQVLARRTLRETTLDGLRLPARASVAVLVGAANRDPARFDQPDTFDPLRTVKQALSFGAGPHYCLGTMLARLEAEIAFKMLLDRFEDITLAGEANRHNLLVLRGYTALPISVRQSRHVRGAQVAGKALS